MLFSSPTFFAFFATYFLFHLLIPARYRIYLIICGSTIFYAWWRVEYICLPYLLMAIAYVGGLWIANANGQSARKWRAAITLIGLFVPLAVFKYADFFYGEVLGPITGWHGKLLDLSLPLGVSFVTFTLTAYVVDIYRGKFLPNRPPSIVLAYVLFFPHLIAGPILRPKELIPQLERPRHAKLPRRLVVPLAIFTVGLVKKLIIADQIAPAVDAVYGLNNAAVTGPSALLAIYGFSVQIYCDFSGYTDMAIGLALLLGVRLPNNFSRPYCASSIIEFWRHWHITLSHWLRDYLYIPLGGRHRGAVRQARNLLLTMLLGGLWHGASWNFVVWGGVHGVGITFVHLLKRMGALSVFVNMPRPVGILLTFQFVTIAWVFFRAPTLAKAGELLAAPFVGDWSDLQSSLSGNTFTLILISAFLLTHRFDDHRRIRSLARNLRPEVLYPLIFVCWVLAIAVSQGNSGRFIYFDF